MPDEVSLTQAEIHELQDKVVYLQEQAATLRGLHLYTLRVWPAGDGWAISDLWYWEVLQAGELVGSGRAYSESEARDFAQGEIHRLSLEDVSNPIVSRLLEKHRKEVHDLVEQHRAQQEAMRNDFLADVNRRAEEYDRWKAEVEEEKAALGKALAEVQDQRDEARQQLRALGRVAMLGALLAPFAGWRSK